MPRLEALEDRMVPSYVFQTIDDPLTGPGQSNNGIGINSSGQVVGAYTDANSVTHGFLLSGGQYTTIADPNQPTGPGSFGNAVGINASGQIIGLYADATGLLHGFLLSGGQYTTLDDPVAVNGTAPFGINAQGTIVGLYFDASNAFHGFVLSGGQYTTIADPSAGSGSFQGTLPFGINASGTIVGEYIDANSVAHGFQLSGGQFTTIDDPLGVQGSNPNGINDHGQIAGAYIDATGLLHGYLLSGGQFTTVDDPAGAQGSFANGVNNSGQIVGGYLDATGVNHAYLATLVQGDSPGAATSLASSGVSGNGFGLNLILTNAALPGNQATGVTGSFGVNRDDGLGSPASGQTTAVVPHPSSLGSSGDNPGGRIYVAPTNRVGPQSAKMSLDRQMASAVHHRAVDQLFADLEDNVRADVLADARDQRRAG